MSKIISTGSTFRIYGDDLVTHNQLPAQIYSIRCSKMTGFYLEKHADIEINEDKIYGVHMEKVNKVLNAFPNFNKISNSRDICINNNYWQSFFYSFYSKNLRK